MEHRSVDSPGYRELLGALRTLAAGSFPDMDQSGDRPEGRQAGTRSFKDAASRDPISAIDKEALVELVPAQTAFILAELIHSATVRAREEDSRLDE
jgi:hypothetical protein